MEPRELYPHVRCPDDPIAPAEFYPGAASATIDLPGVYPGGTIDPRVTLQDGLGGGDWQ